MFVRFPVIGSPELVLRRYHLRWLPWGREAAYLFGESFIKGEQREIFRDPGFGMTLVAGVNSIHFATILHGNGVNREGFKLGDRSLPQQLRLRDLDTRDCGGSR